MNVGVLASGEGTNLQALIDRAHGRANVELVAVASDRPDARALERARAAGVPTASFAPSAYGDRAARDQAIGEWLAERGVELVVLAGYMQLLSPSFLAAFPQRVINVHPALLPPFPDWARSSRRSRTGSRCSGSRSTLSTTGSTRAR